jgi:hypothetical protein
MKSRGYGTTALKLPWKRSRAKNCATLSCAALGGKLGAAADDVPASRLGKPKIVPLFRKVQGAINMKTLVLQVAACFHYFF